MTRICFTNRKKSLRERWFSPKAIIILIILRGFESLPSSLALLLCRCRITLNYKAKRRAYNNLTCYFLMTLKLDFKVNIHLKQNEPRKMKTLLFFLINYHILLNDAKRPFSGHCNKYNFRIIISLCLLAKVLYFGLISAPTLILYQLPIIEMLKSN